MARVTRCNVSHHSAEFTLPERRGKHHGRRLPEQTPERVSAIVRGTLRVEVCDGHRYRSVVSCTEYTLVLCDRSAVSCTEYTIVLCDRSAVSCTEYTIVLGDRIQQVPLLYG